MVMQPYSNEQATKCVSVTCAEAKWANFGPVLIATVTSCTCGWLWGGWQHGMREDTVLLTPKRCERTNLSNSMQPAGVQPWVGNSRLLQCYA